MSAYSDAMNVVPFSAGTSAIRLDVRFNHPDGRTRRFWLRRARTPDAWWGQIFFNGKQHRAYIAESVVEAHRFLAECQREIAELEHDGWQRA